MRLEGPVRYRLSRDQSSEASLFTIADDDGKAKFGYPATSTLPKLYVITVDGERVRYVRRISSCGLRRKSRAESLRSLRSNEPCQPLRVQAAQLLR
jgi:hypothetical protein